MLSAIRDHNKHINSREDLLADSKLDHVSLMTIIVLKIKNYILVAGLGGTGIFMVTLMDVQGVGSLLDDRREVNRSCY